MTQLLFRKLIVENFKSFNGKHVFLLDRGPGLFYVTGLNKVYPELGANGVGKTALIGDPLTWVLWNKTGRDPRPAEAIVPWHGNKHTRVSLLYTKDDAKHKLTRTRHPNHLILDGKEIQQEDVERAIGLTESMTRSAIVLAQFGDLFLDLRAEQQSQMFNSALGLDLWLDASDRARRSAREAEKELHDAKLAISRLEGELDTVRKAIIEAKKEAATWEANHRTRILELKQRLKEQEAILVEGTGDADLRSKYTDLGVGAGLRYLVAEKRTATDLSDRLRREANSALEANAEITEKRRTIERSIHSYETTLKGKRKTCPECGQVVSTDHLEKKLKAAKQELKELPSPKNVDKLNKNLDAYEKQIYSINDEIIRIAKIDERIQSLKSELEKVKDVKKPTTLLDAFIKERKKAKIALKEGKQGIDVLETLIKVDGYWAEAFKTIRLNLIDQVLVELGMASTRHAEALGLEDWRIEFRTEKETKSGSVSVLFQALLFPPDTDVPVKWESYSGGESQRWQLAVAFGLSEIVLDRCGLTPNIEVLDEPTRGLSLEGINTLLEHLRERAIDLNRSIYVIEHHSLGEGFFNDTITIVKDKTGSHVLEKA